MGIGLDNWEQVAEMRAACRELTFGDEQGRENEVWLDYNADLVSRGSDVFALCVYFRVAAAALYLMMPCLSNASWPGKRSNGADAHRTRRSWHTQCQLW